MQIEIAGKATVVCNAKIMKSIKIVQVNKGRSKLVSGKTFGSYRAIAKILKDGERVTVAVSEYVAGNAMRFFDGYGEVELTGNSFSFPRSLVNDY